MWLNIQVENSKFAVTSIMFDVIKTKQKIMNYHDYFQINLY